MLPRALPTALLQGEGDDRFIVDSDAGEVFEVNPTAATIFTLCQEGASLEQATAALVRAFQAAGQEEAIRADVLETVQRFQELGLCARAPQPLNPRA